MKNCSFYEYNGGTKNCETIQENQYLVKLVHLHTNSNPNKIPIFFTFRPSNHISHPISPNPTKINTFIHFQTKISTHNPNTFFIYKYKNSNKIHTFTDYKFLTKFTYKSTSNFSYLTSKNYYIIQQPHPSFLTCNH